MDELMRRATEYAIDYLDSVGTRRVPLDRDVARIDELGSPAIWRTPA